VGISVLPGRAEQISPWPCPTETACQVTLDSRLIPTASLSAECGRPSDFNFWSFVVTLAFPSGYLNDDRWIEPTFVHIFPTRLAASDVPVFTFLTQVFHVEILSTFQ
jgi:hypothetical protein